jgi:gamma-glutamylcysteine synthetase
MSYKVTLTPLVCGTHPDWTEAAKIKQPKARHEIASKFLMAFSLLF